MVSVLTVRAALLLFTPAAGGDDESGRGEKEPWMYNKAVLFQPKGALGKELEDAMGFAVRTSTSAGYEQWLLLVVALQVPTATGISVYCYWGIVLTRRRTTFTISLENLRTGQKNSFRI